MRTLTQMLGHQDLDLFLNKYFTRLPFSMPLAAKNMCHFMDWNKVEAIINEKKSILRIVKDGIMVKDYACCDFYTAMNFYKQGNTLLLKNAERSNTAFAELSTEFSESFQTPVDIQLYCTPDKYNAFDWHYDVEEVFIIQAKGCKEYTIRQNTYHPQPVINSIPKDLGFEKEQSDLCIKVLLTEGDWLYIPSGWWHKALTQSESMHISIGLMPRAAVDFTTYLPQFLAQYPFWRQRIPLHHKLTKDEEKIFYKEAMNKFAEDLKLQFSSDSFLEMFLDQIRKNELNGN